MRESGLSCCKPLPPLNQTRNRTLVLVNAETGIAAMFASVVSPSSTEYKPLVTGAETVPTPLLQKV